MEKAVNLISVIITLAGLGALLYVIFELLIKPVFAIAPSLIVLAIGAIILAFLSILFVPTKK